MSRHTILLAFSIAFFAAAVSGCDTAPLPQSPPDPEASVLFEGEPAFAEAVAADRAARRDGPVSGPAARTAGDTALVVYPMFQSEAIVTDDGLRYRQRVRGVRFPRRLAELADGEVARAAYRLYADDGAVLRVANAYVPGGPAYDEARALLVARLRAEGARDLGPAVVTVGGGARAAARTSSNCYYPDLGIWGVCEVVIERDRLDMSDYEPPGSGGGTDAWDYCRDVEWSCDPDGYGELTIDPGEGTWGPTSDGEDPWPRVEAAAVHDWYKTCSNLPSGSSKEDEEKRNLAYEATMVEAFGASQDNRGASQGYRPLDGFETTQTQHVTHITHIYEVKNVTGYAFRDDTAIDQAKAHIDRLVEHRAALRNAFRHVTDGASWTLELTAPTYTVVTTSPRAPALDYNGEILRYAREKGVNLEVYYPRAASFFDWYLDGYRLNAVAGRFNDWYASVPYGEAPEWGRWLIPGYELENVNFTADCTPTPIRDRAPDPQEQGRLAQ